MALTRLEDKVFEITNPVEVDKEVEIIRQAIGALAWVSHPYHIAQRFIDRNDKGTFYYPETYIQNPDNGDVAKSYHRLTPNNKYKGMFFFVVGKGTPSGDRGSEYMTYPIGVIFSANMQLIDAEKLKLYLFTQELIREVRLKLATAPLADSELKIIGETRDLRETYREFALDAIEQYNRAPLQCFRIDFLLTVSNDCLT